MAYAILIVWLEFLVCLLLIGYAGSRLARYGDVIADKTGLSGTWIGLVLMATVTSLPELFTGISAVTLAAAPNIAVGDVLGSCVFNLALIMVLDFLQKEESVFSRASQGHILAAGFGVILLGIVGFNILLNARHSFAGLGHVGLYTPVIVLVYLVAMRTLFRYEQRQIVEYVEERVERHPGISLRDAVQRYALMASIVVVAAVWLPFIGQDLARLMGWHQTFVGTLFVAMATSVPEVVVTVAALRIGALDMAISNLMGSNLFNVLILAIDDLAYTRGPLLSDISPLHAVSALSAIVMTGLAIVGLIYRPRTRLFKTVGWTSLFLLCVYLLNTFFLFLYGD
jgi:cation:H+ antiporter